MKKKTEKSKPKNHLFCFQNECKHYVEHEGCWVCNYPGHLVSLGCLGCCPKEGSYEVSGEN